VSIAVGQHAALAKAVAAASRDPDAGRRMNDAAARYVVVAFLSIILYNECNQPNVYVHRIARAMQELVNSTKMVITNPNDPAVKKAFGDGVRSLQAACAEGTAITLSPEQQLLEAHAEMARSLEALTAAIANGDRYHSCSCAHINGSLEFPSDVFSPSAAADAALADVLESLKKNMMIAKAISANITDPARKVRWF
jgi:hypothetical protein